MKTVSEIIEAWPSAETLAEDLGLKHRGHARVMKLRGRIPVEHWPRLIDAASRRGIDGVNSDALLAAHSVALLPSPEASQ